MANANFPITKATSLRSSNPFLWRRTMLAESSAIAENGKWNLMTIKNLVTSSRMALIYRLIVREPPRSIFGVCKFAKGRKNKCYVGGIFGKVDFIAFERGKFNTNTVNGWNVA